MTGESFPFTAWITAFSSISALFILLDTLYRVLLTLRHIRMYWRKGVADIPSIDLRSRRGSFLTPALNYIEYTLEMAPIATLQVVLLVVFSVVAFGILVG